MSDPQELRADWGDVDSSFTRSQEVRCYVNDELAGSLTLALRSASDEDDPRVGLSMATVGGTFRGGSVGMFLIQQVASAFPDARIIAGPLSDDEDPGPRYRLRCWVDAGVPVHEAGCVLASCDCLAWIRREVIVRLGRRRMLGGSSEKLGADAQYRQAVRDLGL